jgi:CoA:oxalate CoA-transferase
VEGVPRPLSVVRGGFLVDGTAPKPLGPPPVLGEHTDEIFSRLPKRIARDA